MPSYWDKKFKVHSMRFKLGLLQASEWGARQLTEIGILFFTPRNLNTCLLGHSTYLLGRNVGNGGGNRTHALSSFSSWGDRSTAVLQPLPTKNERHLLLEPSWYYEGLTFSPANFQNCIRHKNSFEGITVRLYSAISERKIQISRQNFNLAHPGPLPAGSGGWSVRGRDGERPPRWQGRRCCSWDILKQVLLGAQPANRVLIMS